METGNLRVWTEELFNSIGISGDFSDAVVDIDGSIYFVTSSRIIGALNPSTNEVTYWKIGSIASYDVSHLRHIAIDPDGNLQLATIIRDEDVDFGILFIRLNPSTNEVTYWKYLSGGFATGNLSPIYPTVLLSVADQQGNVYFVVNNIYGRDTASLIRFIPLQDTVEMVYRIGYRVSIGDVLIDVDGNNSLWLFIGNSSFGEFKILNLEGNRALVYPKNDYSAASTTIAIDKIRDKLYVSTYRDGSRILQQYSIND